MSQAQLKVNPDKPFWIVGKDYTVMGIKASIKKVMDATDTDMLTAHLNHFGNDFKRYSEHATREEAYATCYSPQLREVA